MNPSVKGNFITRDHPYVYLGGSLVALLGLSLMAGTVHPYSFLADNVPAFLCKLVFWAFLALSCAALVLKVVKGKDFCNSIMYRPSVRRFVRWASYLVVLACLLALLDLGLLQLIFTVQTCLAAEKNPQGFESSMI